MKIKIVAVGKLQEAWLREGFDSYIKRLQHYTEIEIKEVKDMPDKLPLSKLLAAEANDILKQIDEKDYVVLLDLGAKMPNSEKFAEKLQANFEKAKSSVCFVIGGSYGLDDKVRQIADERLGLSALTFPHQLARVILAEQLFRAFKILRGEKYHK